MPKITIAIETDAPCLVVVVPCLKPERPSRPVIDTTGEAMPSESKPSLRPSRARNVVPMRLLESA